MNKSLDNTAISLETKIYPKVPCVVDSWLIKRGNLAFYMNLDDLGDQKLSRQLIEMSTTYREIPAT